MISRANAPRFTWLEGAAEGWTLADAQDLHVVEERLPPGLSETRHRHARVRQLYFVLAGEAAIELADARETLRSHEALVVPPGIAHKLVNAGDGVLEFLVVSTSAPRLDREDLE